MSKIAVDPFDLATEFASAIISLILIIVYIIIGLTIISNYFKGKQSVFLYMGLGWIFLSFIWLSFVINVFIILIDPNSPGLSIQLIVIISGFPIGISIPLMVIGFTLVSFEKRSKQIRGITIAIALIYEILEVFFLFFNTDMLAKRTAPLIVKNSIINATFIIIFLLLFVVVGLIFAYNSMKSEDRLVKIKGRLIFIAIIIFTIGAFLDSVRMGLVLDLLDGVLLIFSVIIFYFGFIMPERLKVRLSE